MVLGPPATQQQMQFCMLLRTVEMQYHLQLSLTQPVHPAIKPFRLQEECNLFQPAKAPLAVEANSIWLLRRFRQQLPLQLRIHPLNSVSGRIVKPALSAVPWVQGPAVLTILIQLTIKRKVDPQRQPRPTNNNPIHMPLTHLLRLPQKLWLRMQASMHPLIKAATMLRNQASVIQVCLLLSKPSLETPVQYCRIITLARDLLSKLLKVSLLGKAALVGPLLLVELCRLAQRAGLDRLCH